MKHILSILLGVMLCVSQVSAQLAIYDRSGQEITNTTINLPEGVQSDYYYIVRNTGSSDITNIKSYLKIDRANAVYETDAEWSFCSTGCGIDGNCPAFSLSAGGELEVHLEITPLAATDFTVETSSGMTMANFNIHFGTSAINNSLANTFNVYPSPANDNFVIENNFGSNSYVEIYNVLGQMVKRVSTDNANRVSIDCSSWRNGYYVCRAIKEGKIEKTIKVVVAH